MATGISTAHSLDEIAQVALAVGKQAPRLFGLDYNGPRTTYFGGNDMLAENVPGAQLAHYMRVARNGLGEDRLRNFVDPLAVRISWDVKYNFACNIWAVDLDMVRALVAANPGNISLLTPPRFIEGIVVPTPRKFEMYAENRLEHRELEKDRYAPQVLALITEQLKLMQ
jgi:hypothetical protein